MAIGMRRWLFNAFGVLVRLNITSFSTEPRFYDNRRTLTNCREHLSVITYRYERYIRITSDVALSNKLMAVYSERDVIGMS